GGEGGPELGERWHDGQRLIERDEAVEDLLRDRPAVDVGDERGIECGRIVGDRPPVDAVISRRLTGGREQADEGKKRDTSNPRCRCLHPFEVAYSPPPPSALPMATNIWVEP